MTVSEALGYTKAKLTHIFAPHEAKEIMMHVLNCSFESLIVRKSESLNDVQLDKLADILVKRLKGHPLQQLIGSWSFMGFPIKIFDNVLIPRQDTELLVEKALWFGLKTSATDVLELCTGSGCVAVALAKLGRLNVTACDISKDAIEAAEYNAQLNSVTSIEIIESDLYQNITGKFDMIISNPPYIPTDDVKLLEEAVRSFEPHLALDGGLEGLDFYWWITDDAYKYLKKGGVILFEIGIGQSDAVRGIMESAGFNKIEIFKDLAGIDRVIKGILA